MEINSLLTTRIASGPNISGPPSTPICNFEEFWCAYDLGKLIQLIDRYGLKDCRARFKHLDAFLDNRPGSPRPSIWRLPHLLALQNINVPPEVIRGAADEYGLSQSTNLRQRIGLKEVYHRLLFRGDAMELHPCAMSRRRSELSEELLANDPARDRIDTTSCTQAITQVRSPKYIVCNGYILFS